MKLAFSKATVLTLASAFVVMCFISSASAEKMKITGSNKSERIISQNTLNPGDGPSHVMMQMVTMSKTTSSNTEWNDIPMLDYQQVDLNAGKGNHLGYGYHKHKSGEQTFFKFSGTNQAASDGNMSIQGKFEWTGGTGKFKAIKGGGTYTCTGTESSNTCDWQGEVEY